MRRLDYSGFFFRHATNLTKNFKWNGAIGFFNDIYLCLSVSVLLNLDFAYMPFSTFALAFNSVLTIICALSLGLITGLIVYSLKKHWIKAVLGYNKCIQEMNEDSESTNQEK